MPTYSWKCQQCEVLVDVLCKIADRDIPPTDTCMCEIPQWKRTIEMPAIFGKAAYLDGQRKFSDLRESAKLDRERREARSSEKKKEIAAEIKKLGGKTSES